MLTPGDNALRVDARARVTRRQAKANAASLAYHAARRASARSPISVLSR